MPFGRRVAFLGLYDGSSYIFLRTTVARMSSATFLETTLFILTALVAAYSALA